MTKQRPKFFFYLLEQPFGFNCPYLFDEFNHPDGSKYIF